MRHMHAKGIDPDGPGAPPARDCGRPSRREQANPLRS